MNCPVRPKNLITNRCPGSGSRPNAANPDHRTFSTNASREASFAMSGAVGLVGSALFLGQARAYTKPTTGSKWRSFAGFELSKTARSRILRPALSTNGLGLNELLRRNPTCAGHWFCCHPNYRWYCSNLSFQSTSQRAQPTFAGVRNSTPWSYRATTPQRNHHG
jgi:hypothetical protein